MQPRIQYARTSDGVNIAYAVFGEGTPLVYTPGVSGMGVHYYAELSYSRGSVDSLVGRGFQVLRYDGRGTGSSDRDTLDFSLDAQVADLEAVIDRQGLERLVLLGHFNGAQAAVAYAMRHPERVSHLVLRDPHAAFAATREMFPGQEIVTAMRPLAVAQWELVSLNVAAIGFGFSDLDIAREYAAAIRSGITPEAWLAQAEAQDDIDVTGLLESLSVPTLVVADTAFPGRASVPASTWSAPVKRVAAAIPDARLVTTDDFSAAVGEFVSGVVQARASAQSPTAGALQTILFTDVEGSTALTDRLGDTAAREVMREHERITREALKAHGGSEVKTMGDGFMASFGSATKALECAVTIQKAFTVGAGFKPARPVVAQHAAQLRVRCGLNAGEPIAEDDPDGRADLHGTAVIVAARIAAQAQGGEILVSDVVRQLVAGKRFLFNDRGEHALKGFEDPVRVFAVSWREDA